MWIRFVAGICLSTTLLATVARAQTETATGSATARKLYFMGGIGYSAIAGSSDAAQSRDPGWSLFAGVRRVVGEKLTLGVSGLYSRNTLNEDDFFASRDIFFPNPEDFVRGGGLDLYGATGDVVWEHPVDRTTVAYAKAGAGWFWWSIEEIRIDVERGDLEGVLPPTIEAIDDGGIGGYAGGGLRFPLGENAGLWAELVVHVIAAEGGTMQAIPLRVGISLP